MMAARADARANQRYRTRKDLLLAAARLMRSGRRPTLDEVAEAAMVSRATAYRYFPSIDALLIEAPLDLAVPSPQALFDGDADTDPRERIVRAETAMHDAVFRNEAGIRLMLSTAIARVASDTRESLPIRQNRRAALIEAALAPARPRFDDVTYRRLCTALAIVFGSEAMVVLRDVVRCDEATARDVKTWAVRALVDAALAQSDERPGRGRLSRDAAGAARSAPQTRQRRRRRMDLANDDAAA